MESMTIEQIKINYPNQWVLIGNPELKNPDSMGSVTSKLISGFVLYANTDKKELAYKASEYRKGYEFYTCIYTGEIPKNRKFWL